MPDRRNHKAWFRFSFVGFRRLMSVLCLFALAACSHNGNRAFTAENRVFHKSFGLLDEVGHTLLICPTPEGFTFGVRFRFAPLEKSLALPERSRKRPTVEYWYSVWDSEMYLDKTVYLDSGENLPRNPMPGETMTRENGSIVFSGHKRSSTAFSVSVDYNTDHVVLLPPSCGMGPEIPLKTLVPVHKHSHQTVTFGLLPLWGKAK